MRNVSVKVFYLFIRKINKWENCIYLSRACIYIYLSYIDLYWKNDNVSQSKKKNNITTKKIYSLPLRVSDNS